VELLKIKNKEVQPGMLSVGWWEGENRVIPVD
jgi:hypothetical protein